MRFSESHYTRCLRDVTSTTLSKGCMEDLTQEYATAVALWRELNESTPGLSAPFVVAPDANYRDAAVRLMIVGQETFGWGEGIDEGQSAEELVEILRGWYRSFNLGAKYRSTPFWCAA